MRIFICLFFSITLFAADIHGQSSAKHTSIILYQFAKTAIVFDNEFLFDSSVRYAPYYIQSPYGEKKFSVFGPHVNIRLFSLEDTSGHASFAMSGYSIDSSKSGREKFLIQDVEVRVLLNDQELKPWQPGNEFTKEEYSKILRTDKKSFVLFNDTLAVNNKLILEFRNKKTREFLIRFNIYRIGNPIAPFLTHWTNDSSSKRSVIQFIQDRIASKKMELDRTDDFYEYWPENYGRGEKNITCFESSKLAFYFRKPNRNFSDSSLEYQLTDGSEKDTSWHRSGHMILITQLDPNKQYTMLVRYHDFPENLHRTTFSVMPRWYQTTKYRIIFLLILIAILILIIVAFYKRKIRIEKERSIRMGLEIKSIRAQLNPHFVFNALNSIQGLINKNDIPGANHYLTEFSTLLRDTLVNNDKEFVPLSTELKNLETYLKLEQLRFHFQYQFVIDELINKDATEIPSLLLQPLAENAIKHGVASLQDKGVVTISIKSQQENLLVAITDNGKGFTNTPNTNGLGLKLTKDRIHLLNKTIKGQPIQFSIESTQNTGTTVHLSFKNWL